MHADFLISCKTVEMTKMGGKGQISLYGPVLLLQFCADCFPEDRNLRQYLFETNTIFQEHFTCLLRAAADIPCFSLLRSLGLCDFSYPWNTPVHPASRLLLMQRLCVEMATALPI